MYEINLINVYDHQNHHDLIKLVHISSETIEIYLHIFAKYLFYKEIRGDRSERCFNN